MISTSKTKSRDIKIIQQERNHTLDDFAILTGVRKNMLNDFDVAQKDPQYLCLRNVL